MASALWNATLTAVMVVPRKMRAFSIDLTINLVRESLINCTWITRLLRFLVTHEIQSLVNIASLHTMLFSEVVTSSMQYTTVQPKRISWDNAIRFLTKDPCKYQSVLCSISSTFIKCSIDYELKLGNKYNPNILIKG